MASPRLRRLAADYEMVRAEFTGNPHVHVTAIGDGRPPEGYRVAYKLRGLALQGDQPIVADLHEVEIRLPHGYPRDKPVCVPLTPIFHPNVKGHYCIQDYWAAGQPLTDTIVKIGDMIQYRVYNPKSPLDALAARWAVQNSDRLPIGRVPLRQPAVDIVLKNHDQKAAESTADIEFAVETVREPLPGVMLLDPEPDDFEISLTSSRVTP